MPALLAVMCGLRRGESCALRWRNVELDGAQLSVVESVEQTKSGLRFKSPKSGNGRKVAPLPIVVDELRARRARLAQELLKPGKRISDDDFVLRHPHGSMLPPIHVSQQWDLRLPRQGWQN
jgi:integrase